MPPTSLLPTVQAAFGSAVTLGYNSSTAAHDVYEGYVLSLFLNAATNEGWLWRCQNGMKQAPPRVIFRLGPGRLASKNFTHILLTKRDQANLEAHIGVKVIGKAPCVVTAKVKKTSASVVHEFDLLVLAETDADACRQNDVNPDHRNVVAHAEAKFYGSNLPLPLGRAVVGLAAECDLAQKSVLVTNRNGATVQDLIQHYGVEFRFLVTPNGKGESHLIALFEKFLRAAP